MLVSVYDDGKKNELIGEGNLLLHEVIDKGELDGKHSLPALSYKQPAKSWQKTDNSHDNSLFAHHLQIASLVPYPVGRYIRRRGLF
jgi:hypothetical protein